MNNLPAFAALNEVGLEKAYGMTLRDYFAAKAMQGMLAGVLAFGHDILFSQIAEDAYKQADAMLKAKETNGL